MKRLIFITLMATILAILVPAGADAKVKAEEQLIPMGDFKLTAYCSCEECSGDWGLLTSTGNHCEEGRTVAVDPDVIAYGTRILIDGKVYVAEDCGKHVQGDHIDIYLDDHERVDAFGVKHRIVYLVK